MYSNIIFPSLLSISLTVLSNGLFMTFIILQMKKMDISSYMIGIAHALFYFGMLVGSLKSKLLIYRVGYIRSSVIFNSCIILAMLWQALWPNYFFWAFCRFICGFCLAALYILVESWIFTDAIAQYRGRIMALYMAAIYIPHSASQFMLDLVNMNNKDVFCIAASISALAILPYAYTRKKEPAATILDTSKIPIALYWQKAFIGVVSCIVSGLIISVIYGFLPFVAQEHGLSISYIMGTIIAGGCFMQWYVGVISDLMGRIPALIFASSLNIICALLIIFHSPGSAFVYIYYFCLGIGCFAFFPIAAALLYDKFEKYNLVAVSSFLEIAYCVGCVAGAAFVSVLIKYFSANVIFYHIIFTSLAVLLIAIFQQAGKRII